MFVGDGKRFFLPHIHPCPEVPPSPLPLQEAKEGEGGGGAGLPLGTAVAQSISPKPRKFLLPKRKKGKKKKNSQRPPFLPAPLGQSRLDLWGSWEGGSGLEHSQARVVEFPGRPSARPTLGFSPLPTSFPSKRPTRGGLPRPRALGLQAFTLGPGGGTAQPWRGWAVGPWLPPTMSSAHLPQSWAFPSMSCCGDICSPPQKSVPSSPTFPAEGGADPVLGEEWGLGRGLSAPRGPLGSGAGGDTGVSVLGVFV